ncbi:MAG: LacI family transcriptional regulator [Chloroflexi bacterium]|nr:MAG: LacI family transcriptional regulator [Chloroflexota bacterium]TME37642.1 MAG: LacI family transcriptional regulator [Chloroflexota bacterium]TME53803.1 MAG: LacI family transcriptional regulator [Chloroflexota bacterium]
MSRVTIADVATAAGVSKTAVSFAFNNPERLGHATLERVLGVAEDLGYTPHPAARALSMRRSGTIGLLIPQRLSTVFANPFVSELIQGLGEQCEEHDLTLLLVPPLDGSLEGAIRQASVDGFISLGLSPDDRALEVLDRIGIPTVLVDSDTSPSHPAVNIDDEGGAQAAARHLLQLGHRHFAILVLPPARAQVDSTPTATRRLNGYRKALDSAGAPEPVAAVAGISVAAGARAFESLSKGKGRPTAVLAMSDMAAIGVMSAAQAAGLRVPEDLSVVGFDDVPASAWTNPPLTTVRQPIVEKGRLAARLLIQRMKGMKVESPAPLSTSLVVRKSTSRLANVDLPIKRR